MKKNLTEIPIHKLKDRQASGISIHYIDSSSILGRQHIMRAHRDDHYIFIFQQCGTSNLVVDFKEMTIGSNVVLCVLPGQIHFYKSSEGAKGWFLAIDTLLVEKQYRSVFEEEILMLTPVLMRTPGKEHLDACFHSLHEVAKDDISGIRQSVVSNLSGACIGLIAASYLSNEEKHPHSNNRNAVITRQFHALLKTNFKTIKAPSQYAASLNISLSYLNECIKATTGNSVSAGIHQEIILEAKRLLCYTSLTIKEIAYDLGFEDHSYFSRLFSGITGAAPGQFRKTFHE